MTEIFFRGGAGRIEAKYLLSRDPHAPVALVLHPHPQYGGTMNNKVVYTAYKALAENGFTVLRINFRGVGKSEGEFDNGEGELIDAGMSLDWLQSQNQKSMNFWIVGFSFGAWIGMQLIMRRPEINDFISIAPPVNKFDFSFLYPSPIPGLVIQGDMDSSVPEQNVSSMLEKLNRPKIPSVKYKVVEGADHLFRNHQNELHYVIDQYVKNRLKNIFEDNNIKNISNSKKVFLT